VTIAVLTAVFLMLFFLRVPIAHCIGFASVAAILLTVPFDPTMITMAQRLSTSVTTFTLLAIPFFIFAGKLLATGGSARRLIEFALVTVGFLPGGLAVTNVLANMLFGSISGSASAATSGVGGFMIPAMEKENYPNPFSAALTATAATVGLLVPPSNVFIVYATVTSGVSISALFVTGYLPALTFSFSLMLIAIAVAAYKGYGKRHAPPTFKLFFSKFIGVLPSLFLIVIVMGGIVTGIFTASEASSIAVVYAFILAVVIYREVKLRQIPQLLLETASTTGMVFFLIGTSVALSWVFSFTDVPQIIEIFIKGVSSNPFVILLLINIILLLIGTFMDITPGVLIFTPIFLPIMTELAPAFGITPNEMKYHFGIILVFNLCLGLVSPPAGTTLFIACSIAKIKLAAINRPLIPIFAAGTAALLIVSYFPAISLWLPRYFGLLK
jgi:tripartite ATP-independent transporter DctM subunit